MDGRSATGQEKGGKKRVKIEREAASTGERRGVIGDRSGGGVRTGMNDPETGEEKGWAEG